MTAPDMLTESLKASQWVDFRRENGSQLGSYSSAEILRRIDHDKLIADLERCKAALRALIRVVDAPRGVQYTPIVTERDRLHAMADFPNAARALLAELDKDAL